MWVPDTYEAARDAVSSAWLAVAPKAAGFVVLVRLYLEGVAPLAGRYWVPALLALCGLTIVAGNLMAMPQHEHQAPARPTPASRTSATC